MVYSLYTYYDRVSGLYSAPVPAINTASAVRSFNTSFVNNPNANDMEIYMCGSINIVTGEVTGYEKPEFVARFEGGCHE